MCVSIDTYRKITRVGLLITSVYVCISIHTYREITRVGLLITSVYVCILTYRHLCTRQMLIL